MDVIVRWMLQANTYSCVSGCMVDRRMLLLGGCCRQVITVLSLVV